MIEELVKNFKIFCEMCDGEYCEDIFPECRKLTFKISLEYLEVGDKLDHLSIKIISDEGDEESFALKDVKILEVNRVSENDESGEISYYTLQIITDKGVLSLKRDLREDKLIFEFKGKNIDYRSTVVF